MLNAQKSAGNCAKRRNVRNLHLSAQSGIEKVEGPSPNPRIGTLYKIALALEVRIADLIDDDDG